MNLQYKLFYWLILYLTACYLLVIDTFLKDDIAPPKQKTQGVRKFGYTIELAELTTRANSFKTIHLDLMAFDIN